nr:SGNH/GDSL hydrolase family protein [Paenibacillus agaridevorans]
MNARSESDTCWKLLPKTIIVLSILTNGGYVRAEKEEMAAPTNEDMSELVEKLCLASRHPRLVYIDGRSVLNDLCGLTTDLLHPSDYGHMLIADHIAARLAAGNGINVRVDTLPGVESPIASYSGVHASHNPKKVGL